jgi:hypothetical protein
LQSLKDIKVSISATKQVLVASACQVAVGLVASPISTNVATAPTLVALLDTHKTKCTAVANVLALRNSKRRVAVQFHVLLQD